MIDTTTLTDDQCYRIIQARDARYDGQVYVGVRSTGIYWRAYAAFYLWQLLGQGG